MSAIEEKSKGGKYIKPSVRNAIKKMAYMSQIARSVSLIPSPEEFATQVISEVTILMGKIKYFSERINYISEAYSNFPANFLAESTNNVMDTLNAYAGIADHASQQRMVDVLHTTADNIDSLTTSGIGQIQDAITGSNDATHYLGDISYVHDALNDIDVGGAIDGVNKKVNDKLQSVMDNINGRIKNLQDTLNKTFSDYIVSDQSRNTTANDLQNISDSMSDGSLGGEFTSMTTETMSSIVKNFNIGKITTGFLGLATDVGLLILGIGEIPQLNLERVLAFGKAKLDDIHDKRANATKEYKESDEYKKMVEDAEGDKKKIREQLRAKRKASVQERRKSMESLTKEEREARRSVAKDVRMAKLQAKKARVAQKMKETIGLELQRFENDIKQFGTNIKTEWTIMENQYKESVEEIKKFFTGDPNEAGGSKYIDDCCDAIEVDCDSIKEILKNLTVTITVTVSQIPCPTSLGPCFDNPLYKVLRWFECAKVIFNELRKVINFGLDIVKQIDNLN